MLFFSPLEQFTIISLIPMHIGNFYFSFSLICLVEFHTNFQMKPLRNKSIPGEISKNEQILGEILENSKCISNDIYKVSVTSEGV